MNPRGIVRNVRWGAANGAAFAAIASVTVTLFEIPRWRLYGPHVWAVVASYFACGIAAGGVVGLLRPFTRRRIGALVVGMIAAVPVGVVLDVAAGSTNPGHVDWGFVAFFALVCGPLGGFIRWSQTWGRSSKHVDE